MDVFTETGQYIAGDEVVISLWMEKLSYMIFKRFDKYVGDLIRLDWSTTHVLVYMLCFENALLYLCNLYSVPVLLLEYISIFPWI